MSAGTSKRVAEEIIRYQWYIQEGLDDDAVVSYNDRWLENANRALGGAHVSRGLTEEQVLDTIQRVGREVRADYTLSVKKAILDYSLEDAAERRRLNLVSLTGVVKVLESASGVSRKRRVVQILPQEWREAVSGAKTHLVPILHSCSQLVLDLNALWQREFENRLLLDFGSEGFLTNKPFTLTSFLGWQRDHVDRVRETLCQTWIPAASKMLFSHSPGGSHRAKLYDSVAVLMSNHLRGLVDGTVAGFQGFLLQYGRLARPLTSSADGNVEGLTSELRAVLTMDLVVERGSYKLVPSFEQVQEGLVSDKSVHSCLLFGSVVWQTGPQGRTKPDECRRPRKSGRCDCRLLLWGRSGGKNRASYGGARKSSERKRAS